MRVFIAGAGGTLGLPLVKLLTRSGHTVTGLTRAPAKRVLIESAGATAVIADALDAAAVTGAVHEARPDRIVNLLTALPSGGAFRPRDLLPTNRLRREGSANLLRAAAEAGCPRVVAESFIAVLGRAEVWRTITEDDELAPVQVDDPLTETILALRSLEDQHAEARRAGIVTTVLRYGFFYGRGVASTQMMIGNLRRGTLFVPRSTPGVASWIHIDDAAAATLAVLEHPSPAPLYHIADDEPVTLDVALADAAAAFRTRMPRPLPVWVARWAAPVFAGMLSTCLAIDNNKAKRELNWSPRYPRLSAGFAHMAQDDPRAA